MKPNRTLKYILMGLAVALMGACRDLSFGPFGRGEVVASVGEAKLYSADLEGILSPALDSLDSVRLVNGYVDSWIKRQLKIQASEKDLGGTEEIERMVEEYRNSLLVFELEKNYVETNLDTVITADEMTAYYEEYRNDFRLNYPLVKAIRIIFPEGFRQESKVWELTIVQKPDWMEELIDLFVKNGLEYILYPEWTDLREVTKGMPNISEEAYLKLQAAGNFLQTREGDERYIVIIQDILPAGSVMPPDMAAPTVRMRIIHQRRQELLRGMEDEMYRRAMENGEITINR